jgi:hypothetical protein
MLLFIRLHGEVPIIEHIHLAGHTAAEVEAHVNLETKTVQEFIDLDIFDHRVNENVPRYTIVKVNSKFSHDAFLVSSMVQKHVQTYCIAITIERPVSGPCKQSSSYQIVDLLEHRFMPDCTPLAKLGSASAP